MNSKYKRIILKLSGASFASSKESLNFSFINNLVEQIEEIKNIGIEVAIVVGGGNIMRGRDAVKLGLSVDMADRMGMIATFINALALDAMLKKNNIKSRVLNIFPMGIYGEDNNPVNANQYLEKGDVVIYAGGTGKLGVTNDTAAAKRAQEIKAEVILKATDVDGVYTADPDEVADAKKYDTISYKEALEKELKVLDEEAFKICEEEKIPILVFNIFEKDNLKKAVMGEKIGTVVQ